MTASAQVWIVDGHCADCVAGRLGQCTLYVCDEGLEYQLPGHVPLSAVTQAIRCGACGGKVALSQGVPPSADDDGLEHIIGGGVPYRHAPDHDGLAPPAPGIG